MEKEFRSAYKYQFLSDAVSMAIEYFSYPDELEELCSELLKRIESIRFPDGSCVEGLNLKEEIYLEVYED